MVWPQPISQCMKTVETAVYRTVRTVVCEDAELWNDSWAFMTGYFAIGGRLLTIGGIFYNQHSSLDSAVNS